MSDGGTWVDTQTGKVTTKQPVEGIQLASPNKENGPEEERAIEDAKNAAAPDEKVRDEELAAAQPDAGPDRTVTTASAKPAKK